MVAPALERQEDRKFKTRLGCVRKSGTRKRKREENNMRNREEKKGMLMMGRRMAVD